jgi:signal transduction histidine kinase
MIKKKGQEEMIGFILIIILVAIMALVFLTLSIKKPTKELTSREIENFLHSSLMYTSSCKQSSEIMYDFKDLVVACYNDEVCFDGRDSCAVLNETAHGLIETSFNVGEEGNYKGYAFSFYDEKNKTFLYIKKGNETSIRYGSEVYFFNYDLGENIYIRLRLFY